MVVFIGHIMRHYFFLLMVCCKNVNFGFFSISSTFCRQLSQKCGWARVRTLCANAPYRASFLYFYISKTCSSCLAFCSSWLRANFISTDCWVPARTSSLLESCMLRSLMNRPVFFMSSRLDRLNKISFKYRSLPNIQIFWLTHENHIYKHARSLRMLFLSIINNIRNFFNPSKIYDS